MLHQRGHLMFSLHFLDGPSALIMMGLCWPLVLLAMVGQVVVVLKILEVFTSTPVYRKMD